MKKGSISRLNLLLVHNSTVVHIGVYGVPILSRKEIYQHSYLCNSRYYLPYETLRDRILEELGTSIKSYD